MLKNGLKKIIISSAIIHISGCALQDCKVSGTFLSTSLQCNVAIISDEDAMSILNSQPGSGEAFHTDSEKKAASYCLRDILLKSGKESCEDTLATLEPYCFDEKNEASCLNYTRIAFSTGHIKLAERAYYAIGDNIINNKKPPKYNVLFPYWGNNIKYITKDENDTINLCKTAVSIKRTSDAEVFCKKAIDVLKSECLKESKTCPAMIDLITNTFNNSKINNGLSSEILLKCMAGDRVICDTSSYIGEKITKDAKTVFLSKIITSADQSVVTKNNNKIETKIPIGVARYVYKIESPGNDASYKIDE